MKPNGRNERQHLILTGMSQLPHRMLSMHHLDNISEFILHALADENCFNLSKAAYFVDNEAFDLLKGVAGFNKSEKYHESALWDKPEQFSAHMRGCEFNNQVRGVTRQSPKRNNHHIDHIVDQLAEQLLINHPEYFAWPVKYDNQALLVYELGDGEEKHPEDILKSLCILGFCPIF